ncbi:M61 family metallopeptidase [Flavobacterium orientale]|uniref:Peptidase M61 n=1 Tax=Flavobacterium orientale TaxID=1756020 RepID=A0A917D9T7_9FLAO|nr:peptidase M61 [Flavobacterium orientale]GGD15347.1 peptidase M61 [Flavobacterium orientale]
MKKYFASFCLTSLLLFSVSFTYSQSKTNEIQVTMDLVNINNDRVAVSVTPPKIKTEETTFFMPKIIPGTYSEDNYGRYLDNFKAFDAKGKELPVAKMDENSWVIKNAKKLAKVTYLVNDTFDTETGTEFGQGDIFSPAGTNIEEGVNFVINNHAFVGYFKDLKELPYRLNITKPENLYGATAMDNLDKSTTKDVFVASRYAELVDNPILYTKSQFKTFMVDDMEIILSVYSPNNRYSEADFKEAMETMMKAQKRFLGPIDNTKRYAILLYLADFEKEDARGFGALEHNTSTVVVMPEAMPIEELSKSMVDVVSHEFFHIVTPLSVHSKEIHYFDFNTPKMSQHLWMYEGITEYFANLFQVNQDLISDTEFFERMAAKVQNAKRFDEKMPFTKMSSEILSKQYKDSYLNVYEKGALIAMCLDIQIRESSKGKRGILDLMQKLSKEYGSTKPFEDAELFDKIVALTYPEVRTFLDTYVAGPAPLPYQNYFEKMGVTQTKIQVPGNVFLKGQSPYITVNPSTKEIIIIPGIELNTFMKDLGLQGGDIILAIDDVNYDLDNIYDMITKSMSWKENDPVQFKIKRGDKESVLKGVVKIPYDEMDGFQATDASKKELMEAWLRG